MGIVIFKYFNDHHFKNGVNEVTYSLLFFNNILICCRSIHQVLEHVCVILQYAFRVKYYKCIIDWSWFT